MFDTDCSKKCWIAGGITGLLVLISLWGIGSMGFFAGLVLGLITAGMLGSLLVWLVCGHQADEAPIENWTREETRRNHAVGTTASAAVAADPLLDAQTVSEVVTSDDKASAAEISPGGQSAKNTEREEPKSNDIYGSKSAEKAETAASDETAKSEKKSDDKPKADKKAKKAEKDEKPKAKKADKADKPKNPKSDKKAKKAKDDLKQIKGVGPKLEDLLHDEGITSFQQIANWRDEDIDHYAEKIGRFGPRIRADDWVEQAKTLAQGGETEFAARVKDGDVY